ncbi:MAG: hypothetical protein ACXWEW_10870 [Nitrososphaeraceae archaeon]
MFIYIIPRYVTIARSVGKFLRLGKIYENVDKSPDVYTDTGIRLNTLRDAEDDGKDWFLNPASSKSQITSRS